MSHKFPHYLQPDAMDCGPTCLRMIAKHYGKNYSLETLRNKSFIGRDGVSLFGISEAAETLGFRTLGVAVNMQQLITEAPLPCILHWNQNHFVVLYHIQQKGKTTYFHISDPASGKYKLTKTEFEKCWLSTKRSNENTGICLLIETTPDFYAAEDEKQNKASFKFLLKYLLPYRKLFFQLILALFLGSVLQLIFPFLTQSVVDLGISTKNIEFVYLLLIAQLFIYFGKTSLDFIRGWLLLHISTRINISLISDFLIKLMKLPIRFFDTKLIGDLMQRISDHDRIENFITGSTLNILFSFINFIVFGIVLLSYSVKIFFVFLLGSTLYVLWILIFMKRRRELDNKRFAQMSSNQSNLYQLITGMQEIKLNNCERQKRWEWERIQAGIFKVNMQSLSLSQYQQAGSVFINELKNIFITFLSATAVINGNISLGMMLSIQYIIGQLNSPLEQMINFIQVMQNAKISMERLSEIHNKDNELDENKQVINELSDNKTISVENLCFNYNGNSENVLNNINLEIPKNKVTAIVGASGSGKTTLIKLLLGFYPPTRGNIKVGFSRLEVINQKFWRSQCGVVMQDGFIFSDTIAKNIAVGDENIDKTRLNYSVEMANIKDFIESLPLSYNTKIGQEGNGLSQGQKQRILIARAIYKNPEYIFLDEATNALDANNEKIIIENFNKFFVGKTVIVVAHRLSTVKNADKIIVLEKGEIVESGTHLELTNIKGKYYHLVKNQLELGN